MMVKKILSALVIGFSLVGTAVAQDKPAGQVLNIAHPALSQTWSPLQGGGHAARWQSLMWAAPMYFDKSGTLQPLVLAKAEPMTKCGIAGTHFSVTVQGQGRTPGRSALLAVGRGEGLRDRDMAAMYDEVRAAVEQWPVLADEAGVSDENVVGLRSVFARMMAL